MYVFFKISTYYFVTKFSTLEIFLWFTDFWDVVRELHSWNLSGYLPSWQAKTGVASLINFTNVSFIIIIIIIIIISRLI
jgi:hypothetical protein